MGIKNTATEGGYEDLKEIVTKIMNYVGLDSMIDHRGSTDILDKVGVKV